MHISLYLEERLHSPSPPPDCPSPALPTQPPPLNNCQMQKYSKESFQFRITLDLLPQKLVALLLKGQLLSTHGPVGHLYLWELYQAGLPGEVEVVSPLRLRRPHDRKEHAARHLAHQIAELGEHAHPALGFGPQLPQIHVLKTPGKVEATDQRLQIFLGKLRHFIGVELLVDCGGSPEGEFALLLETLEALEPGEEGLLVGVELAEELQFGLEDVVGDVDQFLADGEAEEGRQVVQEAHQVCLLPHVVRQFSFLAFGQQFVVVDHGLELVLAAQLEGQGCVQGRVAEAQRVAELFLQALLQQLHRCALQTPGIVGVDAGVEAGVYCVLEVGFKIEERGGGGAFGAQTNGGVLVGYFEVQVELLVHALRLVPLLVRHLDRIIFNAGNIIKTTLSAPFPHPPLCAPLPPASPLPGSFPPSPALQLGGPRSGS